MLRVRTPSPEGYPGPRKLSLRRRTPRVFFFRLSLSSETLRDLMLRNRHVLYIRRSLATRAPKTRRVNDELTKMVAAVIRHLSVNAEEQIRNARRATHETPGLSLT
ncbi:hypothetical protein PUN28_009476 [Cardiocondyla obscurior]|uniref:Uncharacterized protein n=1 Tax=Cardiocondyla obscurior TaxID=286306 RepID=A0AAW2FUQ1_9HYME